MKIKHYKYSKIIKGMIKISNSKIYLEYNKNYINNNNKKSLKHQNNSKK